MIIKFIFHNNKVFYVKIVFLLKIKTMSKNVKVEPAKQSDTVTLKHKQTGAVIVVTKITYERFAKTLTEYEVLKPNFPELLE